MKPHDLLELRADYLSDEVARQRELDRGVDVPTQARIERMKAEIKAKREAERIGKPCQCSPPVTVHQDEVADAIRELIEERWDP